ncbi:MAG: hypothetical protein WA951_10820 [Leeuwenhoekiella sp.]
MFLDIWRDKRIKRNLEDAIASYTGPAVTSAIKRIGLLIDTTENVDVEMLSTMLEELQHHVRVNVICYVDSVSKIGFNANSTFDKNAFNWQGELNNVQVDFFLNQEYDLMISYYARPLPLLKYVTASANANFKVGFPGCDDHRLNDLTIDTKPENVAIFVNELNSYLRILKRID